LATGSASTAPTTRWVGVSGTIVRLRSSSADDSVVLLPALLAAPDFQLLTARPEQPRRVDPIGLLDALPQEAVAQAREWERHNLEIETGQPPPGTAARRQYSPNLHRLGERQRAKAEELTRAAGRAGVRTLERLRARYLAQGIWGLVDRRVTRPVTSLGRADPRLIDVIRECLAAEVDASTGTRDRLLRGMRRCSWCGRRCNSMNTTRPSLWTSAASRGCSRLCCARLFERVDSSS